MNKEFDNIIKDKLGNFEEAPPTYMWDKIASGIPAATTQTVFYKTTSFKIIAVAASIAVIIGLSWVFTNDANKNNLVSKSENKQIEIIEHTANKDNTTKNEANNNNNIEANNTYQKAELTKPNNLTNPKTNTSQSITPIEKNSKPKHNNITKNTKTTYSNSSNNISANNSRNTIKPKKEQAILTTSTFVNKNIEQAKTVEITKVDKNAATQKQQAIVENKNIKETENIEAAPEKVIVTVNNNTEEDIKQELKTENTNKSNENSTLTEAIESSKNTELTVLENDDSKLKKDFNPKTREFNKYGLGIHYGYEYVKLNDDNIKIHNLDMSFNYRNLNFILQTGIGGQYSKDERAYNLEYKKNEYLTTEVRFDSAQFVLDSTGTPQLIPVNPYYTDVYDSVNYMQSDNFTESYYSLRIPLMVGYQKDFGKFGGFIKGGFIYSVLITKNRSEVYSLDESSRLVMLQYSGSKRVDSQIQYVMSGGLVFRINKKLHLQTEIMGKYYQSSIYDNPIYNNIKPWSIEGRIGFVYFLN